MRIKQKLLAVLGLGWAVLLLSAPSVWAQGGGGGGGGTGLQLRYQFEPDADEAMEEPGDFEGIPLTGFTGSLNAWRLGLPPIQVTLDGETIAVEPEPENSQYYTPRYSGFRFQYRYSPQNEEEEKQPVSTRLSLNIQYKFQTWTSFDATKTFDDENKLLDDDQESPLKFGLSSGVRLDLRLWAGSRETHESIQNHLGNAQFDRQQAQFGSSNDGGLNLSSFNMQYQF